MNSFHVLLFTIVIATFNFSQAMRLGDITIAGNGCFGSSKLIPIKGSEGRYAFPIRVRVNKKSETAFDRKTCNIRLPVQLQANEKLQLLDLSQVVRVVGYKGANIKTALNMGLVGQSSKSLTFENQIIEDELNVVEILKAQGVVAESACGQDVMLTGNLSAFVTGSGTQAFVSTGTALLSLKVVPCSL